MPRIHRDYSFRTEDEPKNIFGNLTTSETATVTYVHPTKVPWLTSNNNNKFYGQNNTTDSYHKGLIWIIDVLQNWFYQSLKDILSETSLATFNDDNQSITIFGITIHPILWVIYPSYNTWYNNASYSRQYRAYPVIFRENDCSLALNSFVEHPLDNSNSYSTVVQSGKEYSSSEPNNWWIPNATYGRNASVLPFIGLQNYSTLEEACNALNDVKMRLTVHYNTDYLIVSYRGHDISSNDIPLFSMLKGTIQNSKKTSIVWCCGCPNDHYQIDSRTDYKDYHKGVKVTGGTNRYISVHKMVLPNNPDYVFEYDDDKQPGGVNSGNAIGNGNTIPYWLDWREPNSWLKQLIDDDTETPTYVFRKQSLTAFSRFVQFSSNIIYADENCSPGQYYEIDGDKYWCPSNGLFDYYYANSSYQQYYKDNYTRILVKI